MRRRPRRIAPPITGWSPFPRVAARRRRHRATEWCRHRTTVRKRRDRQIRRSASNLRRSHASAVTCRHLTIVPRRRSLRTRRSARNVRRRNAMNAAIHRARKCSVRSRGRNRKCSVNSARSRTSCGSHSRATSARHRATSRKDDRPIGGRHPRAAADTDATRQHGRGGLRAASLFMSRCCLRPTVRAYRRNRPAASIARPACLPGCARTPARCTCR